jgi:hypothetical protein
MFHHRADNFIQDLPFHYFTSKKEGMLQREKGGRRGIGTLLRPMEYVRGFLYK